MGGSFSSMGASLEWGSFSRIGGFSRMGGGAPQEWG